MITRINPKKIDPFFIEFLSDNFDYDFFLTENNERIYITDRLSFKKMLKGSICAYMAEEKGYYKGVILLWKSEGGGKKRFYVKLNAVNKDFAQRLLTVLIWNNSERDIFVKVRKDSGYLPVYKKKGFRFKGGRGVQLLLHRKKERLGDQDVRKLKHD